MIERLASDLRTFDFPGEALDVRENVKFQGGHFPRWVNARFEGAACAVAIEFKKFFMDEWSGEPDRRLIDAIRDALNSALPGIMEQLDA